MKLPIKKEFFDKIRNGEKTYEYRDAHITFVCEETGETLKMNIMAASILWRELLPDDINRPELFEDERIIRFRLQEVE